MATIPHRRAGRDWLFFFSEFKVNKDWKQQQRRDLVFSVKRCNSRLLPTPMETFSMIFHISWLLTLTQSVKDYTRRGVD